jgi:hypothetical protein
MITNEKQYRSARAAIDRIADEVAALRKAEDGVHPVLRRAQIDGLESQVADLVEGSRALPVGQPGAVVRYRRGPRHHSQGKRAVAHRAPGS